LHSSICMLLSSSILGLNPLRLETPWTRGALVPVRTQMRSACRRCRRSWLIRSSALALSLSLSLSLSSLFSLLIRNSQLRNFKSRRRCTGFDSSTLWISLDAFSASLLSIAFNNLSTYTRYRNTSSQQNRQDAQLLCTSRAPCPALGGSCESSGSGRCFDPSCTPVGLPSTHVFRPFD
jgi:hypothetical protein